MGEEGTTWPQVPENSIETPSEPHPAQDKACRCCEECMAAMKSTKGKEEGTPKTSGCRDCCERCGKVKHPIEKQVPPEIVK